MTDLKRHNHPFFWCTVFLRELYQSGVRHVVISPGSRSTPLTLAAAVHPGLRKHVVLDERSAGFTALGLGKATGRPAVLVCTSGTATANYYPAVIEARQSGVPLLLATADRPPHLRNTDANQTIDQMELYGKFAILFKDIGEPAGGEPELHTLTETARQAFEQATYLRGPVHLNFPFSKPLEPEASFIKSVKKENENLATINKNRVADKTDGEFHFPGDILQKLNQAGKPIIIIGQLPADVEIEPIFKLADQLKSPVLSEQGITGSAYAIQGFEGFLRTKKNRKYLEPDLILRFGLQPASKSLLLALNYWQPEHHIYVTGPANPKKTSLPVSDTLTWNGKDMEAGEISGCPESWAGRWKKAVQHYAGRKATACSDVQELTDGHVYERLSGQIPENWSIFFSNSFPARDRSMFGKWSTQQLFTNRGASGIDGITSTALGIGIGTDRAGVLFTGDLAFLHDTNALLNHKLLTQPLIVVVINNKGGSIFRMLPIAGYEQYFNPYFETPQQADISKLAGSYGVNHQKIETVRELNAFRLKGFITKSGSNLYILECQTDPEASMQLRKKLWRQN